MFQSFPDFSPCQDLKIMEGMKDRETRSLIRVVLLHPGFWLSSSRVDISTLYRKLYQLAYPLHLLLNVSAQFVTRGPKYRTGDHTVTVLVLPTPDTRSPVINERRSQAKEVHRARGSKCRRLRLDREVRDTLGVRRTQSTTFQHDARMRKPEPAGRKKIDLERRGTRGKTLGQATASIEI